MALQQEFDAEVAVRRTAAERNDRDLFLASDAPQRMHPKAVGLVKEATGDVSYNDVNCVFSVHHDAAGSALVGLMIAAIFAAAMSASGGELNTPPRRRSSTLPVGTSSRSVGRALPRVSKLATMPGDSWPVWSRCAPRIRGR